MAAYINEEYYDMLMAFAKCQGQYYVAARGDRIVCKLSKTSNVSS